MTFPVSGSNSPIELSSISAVYTCPSLAWVIPCGPSTRCPSIRIGKDEGLEAPRIIDPVLVHSLDRIHAHLGHIDGRGNAARPDVVAGNLGFILSGQGGRQVVFDIDGAGKGCFVELQVVQLQVAPFPAVRKNLRKIGGDLIAVSLRGSRRGSPGERRYGWWGWCRPC